VPLYERASKKSKKIGTVEAGAVLDGFKVHTKAGHEWIELPDQGVLYVGKRKVGEWDDPAVKYPGKVATLTRLLARLPRLRGYKYGRDADFPSSLFAAPPRHIDTGTKELDCSSFTWCVLNWIYDCGGLHWYMKHQIIGTPDPWSALKYAKRYLVVTEIGEGVPHHTGLYLCQAWRQPDAMRGGHQFILQIDRSLEGVRHRVIQASSHPQAEGVPTWNYYELAANPYAPAFVDRDYFPGPGEMRWGRLADVDAWGALI
jgi:hypothetical protein